MPLTIERRVSGDTLLVYGRSDDNVIAFAVVVSIWETNPPIGYSIGRMVIEVDWLEVYEDFRSLRTVFKALCEALGAATYLGADMNPLVAVVPAHDTLRERLMARDEFKMIGSHPFPFVAELSDIGELQALVCR